jgi:hypothetical protein
MFGEEHLHQCNEGGCSNLVSCEDDCDEEIESVVFCDEHGGIEATFGNHTTSDRA